MHMGLQDKLQHYAAPSDAIVVGIDGPLTADAIVDAHLQALAAGRTLTIVHAGAPTAVALRTAARFRATLVDAASIQVPEPAHAPAIEMPIPALPEPMLPSPEPVLALPAHEAPIAITVEPELPLLEEGTLPWDPATQAPEPSAAAVEEGEFESMPWNVVHHQLLPAGRSSRPHHAPMRATTAPQHSEDVDAARRMRPVPDWGLPWPRPAVPTGGLAVADPRIWKTQERIGAIREDLDRAGAPSFGVAKPEGSAWLKRLHEFGSP